MESKSEGKSHWEDKGGDPDQDDKDLIAKVQGTATLVAMELSPLLTMHCYAQVTSTLS